MNAEFRAIFYAAIYCIFSVSLAAQQNNSLSGKILFLNSNKTPAVGVEISGSIRIDSTTTINANPVYTANDGSYTLVFPKAVPGHVVELKVGNKDGRGEALEIVNEEELRICRIPENPAEDFEIIVCKKGERDVAAKRYYNILKTSADLELEKMKKEWSALVAQSEKDYKKVMEMSKRIDELQKQTDSLKLYKDALRIASINKDNATKRVLRYLKRLDEGTSIQEARKELSINKAIDDLEVGILKFNAAVTELQTRATASKSMFDYKDAIKCYDTLISYAEKAGVDRLRMAYYYNEISIVIFDDGDYKKALEYDQKSMVIKEAVLESQHPDLAASYNNIGLTYRFLGRDSIALKYLQKVIIIRETVLDIKHPDLANSYNSIGGVYESLGQYDKALDYYQKAMNIREAVLDIKHPDLAKSYNNMGTIYEALGQYEKALEYHQKTITIRELFLGKRHPDLAQSYNNMGTAYKDLGQYEKALKYHQKAVSIRKEILDPKHPKLAISYNNTGVAYEALGQYDKALEYHQKAMLIRKAVLNPKNPSLATSYNNIGSIYWKLHQYEKALEYYQKAIYIQKIVLGLKHPKLAISYNNIGLAYSDLDQYEKALEYHQKAIYIQENIDPKHFSLGIIYANIAVTYGKMKIFQKALTYMEKCLAILKKALPENHPYQRKALNSLAGIYYDSKNYPKAIEFYQKVATTFPEIKQEDFYNNIGLAYTKNKQFKEAYNAFSEYEKLFPKKGKTYRNWAMYYVLRNEKEKALSSLQKAVALGYDDLEWLKTDDSMDGLRNEAVFIEIVQKLEQEQSEKKQ